MDYDAEFPIPTCREREAIGKYLNIETEFMADESFFENHQNMQIRKNAVHTIFKLSQGGDLDAFVPYLAMNYFDRFVSQHKLPGVEVDDAENVSLLAICCFTIASKMRRKSFSVSLFLTNKFLNIAHEKIMKMEFCILNGLNWRMRSVTPFCFLDYYYPRYRQIGGFKRRCINEIIVQSQGENFVTRCRPSVIASSSFLAATSILYASIYPKVVRPEDITPCLAELIELCHKKKIVIERAESTYVSQRIPAALPEGQPEEVAAAETESSQQRRGKAPVVAEGEADAEASISLEIVPAADAEPKKPLNFELQWVTDAKEDPIRNIPPSVIHERSVTRGSPAASTREVDNVRDEGDSSKICGLNCDLLANIFSCRSCSRNRNAGTDN